MIDSVWSTMPNGVNGIFEVVPRRQDDSNWNESDEELLACFTKRKRVDQSKLGEPVWSSWNFTPLIWFKNKYITLLIYDNKRSVEVRICVKIIIDIDLTALSRNRHFVDNSLATCSIDKMFKALYVILFRKIQVNGEFFVKYFQ